MLALCSQAGFAQRYYNQTYKPKRSTGSTRTAQGVLQQGLSFGVNAIYYFGDVDIGKLPVVNGMSINEMSGSGYVAYHMPFSKNFGMRYTGTIGLLKADNTEAWKNDPVHTGEFRKFTSVFLQPAVGVEAYPIQEYVLYFYLGISATAS